MLLPVIRCLCFIRIFLRFGVAELKVVTKGKISFDVLGLFFKVVLQKRIQSLFWTPCRNIFLLLSKHPLTLFIPGLFAPAIGAAGVGGGEVGGPFYIFKTFHNTVTQDTHHFQLLGIT